MVNLTPVTAVLPFSAGRNAFLLMEFNDDDLRLEWLNAALLFVVLVLAVLLDGVDKFGLLFVLLVELVVFVGVPVLLMLLMSCLVFP